MIVREANPELVRDVEQEVRDLVNSSKYSKSNPPQNGAAGADPVKSPGAPISEVVKGSR
jgi:hypothetical protein